MKMLLTRVTVVIGLLSIGSVDAVAARRSAGTRQASNQGSDMSASDESATQKVVARGVGKDKTAALKDAYRAAVEKAVGLYVDAETVADNDELVEDQVLTHSNAYIESYDELGTKQLDSGLVQVRISAIVRKSRLIEKLGKVLPSGKPNGYTGSLKDIHAQIVSEEKRDADGYKLLQNTLMGIDPCTLLAVPSVDMTHKQVIKEGKLGYRENIPEGQVVLRLLLRLKFNEVKYFKEFVPVVKPILDQIASSSKNVKLSLLEDPNLTKRFFDPGLDDYLDISGGSQELSKGSRNGKRHVVALMDSNPCMSPMRVLYGGGILLGMEGSYFSICNNRLAPKTGCRAVQFQSGGSAFGRGWEKRNEYHLMNRIARRHGKNSVGIDEVLSSMSDDRYGPLKDQCKQQLILVCGVNKAHTVWNAVFYTIDKKSAAVFMLWCNKYASGNSGYSNKDRAQTNSIKYNVSYCDKSGDCVLVNTWHVPRVCIMNADWGDLGEHSDFKDCNVLYISPFLGCYSEEFVQWHDVLIRTDLLPEIESVKIELAD